MRNYSDETRRRLSGVAKDFSQMCAREGVDSGEITGFLNDNLIAPSFLHYNMLQLVWERDRQYFKGIDEKRVVDLREGWEDYEEHFSKKFHEFYFREYVERIFEVSRAERRDIVSNLAWGDLRFIVNLRKRIELERPALVAELSSV